MTTTPTPSPYGNCPVCGSPGISRERRPDGNDKCANGHLYKSSASITSAEPAPLPDDVEATMSRLVNVMANNCYDQSHVRETASNEMNKLRAHIAALTEKNTTLRNAAEIGLTYVLAAQRGLTFIKPRMASDVEVFNDALKTGGE